MFPVLVFRIFRTMQAGLTENHMLRKAVKRVLVFFFLGLLAISCSPDRKINKEIKQVDIDRIMIHRYELALFNVDTLDFKGELKSLQSEFRPFLNADLDDPENIRQVLGFVNDPVTRDLFQTSIATYPDLSFLEDDLLLAFKHIKYYFPDWFPPEVYTYVSGLFYESPVNYTGDDLVIAIDMYLGNEFEQYRKVGIPNYKISKMNREYILADCIDEIIRTAFISENFPDHLLDKMIYEGRILHLIDVSIPWVSDEYKIGYTEDELRWCKQNEVNIWAYFVENELLYNSDPLIVNRFVNEGPFTAPFGNESPARAAIWTGWQVVKAYVQRNPEITAIKLADHQDSRSILQQSGYKPRRFGF